MRKSSIPNSPHLEMLDAGKFPNDPSNEKIPDLSYYTESAQFYYDLLVDSVRFFPPYAAMLSESTNWDQKQGPSNVWCGLRAMNVKFPALLRMPKSQSACIGDRPLASRRRKADFLRI